jgi:hypothetical protein
VWKRRAVHFLVNRKQRKKQEGTMDKIPQSPTPIVLLPPVKFHLLKFPEIPKIAQPARQAFNT